MRRALDDDRERDDHEDDPVDPVRVVDAGEDRERGEEDRHRALQPAPGDEQPLPDAEAGGKEQDPDDERAGDERDDDREHDAVEPDGPGETR